jgi:transposase
MPPTAGPTPLVPLAALIGIDWADQHHDVALQVAGTVTVEHSRLTHEPNALAAWLTGLAQRFAGQRVGIALETSRGPLVHARLEAPFVVLYPVNPRSLQCFRETFTPSGAKDDAPDARLLLELLVKHRDQLAPWVPADAATRTLRALVERRRTAVELRTQLTLQLQATLKDYFPQALTWAGTDLTSPLACAFLTQWPTLAALQRARPSAVRRFYLTHRCRRPALIATRLAEIATATPLTHDPTIVEPNALFVQLLARQLAALGPSLAALDAEIAACFAAHPDAELFRALPGAGAALAPRLLVAFGTDRTRFPSAADVQQCAGIAPVTVRSGRSCQVHWRWSVSTFLRQTFHEFAHHSILHTPWARAFYHAQRARGKTHHVAVRALAFKWIRILWRCWQDHTPYDDARYTRALILRGSPIAAHLQLAATEAAA